MAPHVLTPTRRVNITAKESGITHEIDVISEMKFTPYGYYTQSQFTRTDGERIGVSSGTTYYDYCESCVVARETITTFEIEGDDRDTIYDQIFEQEPCLCDEDETEFDDSEDIVRR